MKLKDGDRIRMAFEYYYDSCNWRYIVDFEVKEILGKLFLYTLIKDEYKNPKLCFWIDNIPVGMEILRYDKIRNNSKEKSIYINCTGNEEWCNHNSTIKSIVSYHYEKINA